jgi:hypothetical protein
MMSNIAGRRREEQVEPASYGFSFNPLPALVIAVVRPLFSMTYLTIMLILRPDWLWLPITRTTYSKSKSTPFGEYSSPGDPCSGC